MRKTYNAKLVPMEKGGYHIGDIGKRVKMHFAFPNEPIGFVRFIRENAPDGIHWQAQRLVITDEAGADVAVYPKYELAPIPQIDISDIRRWIESGCHESVELEVIGGVTERFGKYAIKPSITNNTVKMVWGEKKTINEVFHNAGVSLPDDMKPQPIAGAVEVNPSITALQRAIDKLGDAKMREIADSIPYDPNGMTADEYFARLSGHHPATDWDALRDKFKDTHCVRNGIGLDITDIIFNFFKNEINGK